MAYQQQYRYGQVPGAYPAEEGDEDEETFLQMMNELAEEECSVTPQQFQHQYASQTVPAQESSYQVAASHQQQDGNRIVPAERPSYRRPAGRQHPYARPSVPAPRSSYHTSAYANHGMRQAGPIRHRRNAPNSQDLNNRRLEFDQQEPSAQLHLSEDHEGYGRSPPLYDAVNSDFQKHRPSQGDFGNEHGNRPSTEHNNLEQSPEFQSVEREAGKPKEAKQKRATKAKGSKEDKKPTKSKVKGRTRFENGRLECVGDGDTRGQRWEPAVRMQECRRELIDQQNRLAIQLGMSYRDPDPVGTGADDETAFKVEHADWDSDRTHLPAICWRYNEDEENNPRPSNNPGYMRFKGMIVLDPNDDPVKDWPQLPATLSSKARGYRLEIMSRENPHLEYKDFIARMPSVIEKTKKDKATGKIEVVMEAPDPNVVCNMRMLRFRREKGLLSWKDKGNTKVIGEGLEKLFGDRLVNNSMQSFGRDLTTQEQVEIRKGKGARFPDSHPAGGPLAQAATKKRKNKGATKTVTQQSDAQVQEAPRTKRTREDDEEFDSADDQNLEYATAASYRKRRRNARGEASRPATNMEDDQDLSATRVAPGFDEVESNPSPPASYYEEDSDDYISKDQDQGDEEYKTRRIHRPIRAMPARRTRRGAEKAPHLFSAQIQEQTYGFDRDDATQTNATDEDININMNNADGLVDELFSREAYASVEDQVEADVEEDEDEDVTTILPPVASPLLFAVSPNLPQETDLDRHRRQTRELLGEEDDGFFTRIPWSPGWSCTYPT